ncbi:MAG TPA: helix-turn-helix domain-containing protein [Propionibacteriaceae bacterium]|nr:helix-turn-helix domain-containing protein [Propionibacteriaceae bacterium]
MPAQGIVDLGRGGGAFGERLRSLRERAGFTQEELADRAGLTPNAVSALERGTRTHPYPHTVRSLADALGLSSSERADLVGAVPRRGRSQPEGPAAATPSGSVISPADAELDLVVPPTPLFGRDEDIAEVATIVRSGRSRLVTLVGPGGVGKTRLAMAVAQELAGDHPEGIVPVSLAARADADDVLGMIGRALRVAGLEQPDGISLLRQQLGERRLVLILDNFEHLLSAAPEIGRLVAACPHLTVLVTSRAPLRVRGEQEYAVAPLTLPAADVATVEDLTRSASGAFVLHRMQEVSALALTGRDVRALGELCRRLAGLPLAIELATAHLRLLQPEALLERLDRVKASSPRDLPERQRTMRATLDWSYRLLSASQQTLFRLLGVFRGGATLTALEDVAAGSASVDSADVLALLEGLAEHSLVAPRTHPELGQRYDTLEPVAQYARSLLVGDEAVRAARAHAAAFLSLAEQAVAGYEGPDQLRWLDRIEVDEANVLVAIDRSLDLGDGETAGRIVWAMWLYWWLRGKPRVGRKRALRCLDAELSPPVRARVHLTAATTSFAAGEVADSAEHWARGFALATELDDIGIAGAARAGTGLAAMATGDLDQAEEAFRAALPLSERAGDWWMTSLLHVWLGTILLGRDAPGAAIDEIGRGLTVARSRGDRLAIYVALYNLAQAAVALGDSHAARLHLREGIVLSEQNHDSANLAYFLEALAVVESAEQTPARVPVLLGAAQALHESTENKSYGYYQPDESRRKQAEMQARQVLGDDAYAEALARGRGLDMPDIVRFAVDPSA